MYPITYVCAVYSFYYKYELILIVQIKGIHHDTSLYARTAF
jgi:hypothetical protein